MEENVFESDVFTLTDEEGNEIDFEVIDSYEKNGETYFALIPLDAEDITDGDPDKCEYVILKLAKDGDEDIFVTVDDEDELDDIADYFDDKFTREIDYDND